MGLRMATTTMADLSTLTDAEIVARVRDPMWRLCNLYKIITKGDDDDEGLVVTFRPNRVQRRILAKLHTRNVILKARQLGCTTLITILWLDTALFSDGPISCGIVAHEREAAEAIFLEKVVYAYEHLPEVLRKMFPLKKRTQTQLVFAHNGAKIRVATSMRSGTTHRLHVSELGKIAAKYPAKAREVLTGSIPSVPKTGLLVVESTAEGLDGPFHDMVIAALDLARQRAALNPRQYLLHFFPWWQADEYEIDPVGVVIPQALQEYFARTEARIGRALPPRKRAWYAATLAADFAGEQPLMWQEYPSYPEEAFAASTDGCYYATQLAVARRDGRIVPSLPVEAVPTNTFWDLGRGDMTSLWLHQRVGVQNRFIGYYEESGYDLVHYVQWLEKQARERGLVYGRHYLPHEAAARRMGATPDTSRTLEEMFLDLMPGAKTTVVPRVTSLQAGIQATRNSFASSWFDETHCHQGLKRLAGYKKRWDKVRGRWSEDEDQTDDNHAADAYRQYGQEADAGNRFAGAPLPASTGGRPDPQVPTAARSAASRWRRRGSPMAV